MDLEKQLEIQRNERSCDYVTTKVISKCCVLCMK
jgi:hypothetical protein